MVKVDAVIAMVTICSIQKWFVAPVDDAFFNPWIAQEEVKASFPTGIC